jgi:DNA-binding MarR family transcriptional regulator
MISVLEWTDSPADVQHRQTVADVRRGAGRLARRLRMERPDGGLSATKLAVLVHLSVHGSTAPSQIAGAERMLPQSLTKPLAELQSDGLIGRERDPSDARKTLLALTEAGTEALRADMAGRDDWLESAMTKLTDIEVQVLLMGARIMDRIA